MSEETAEPAKKKGKGLLFGLIGALALGGGGAYATYSGLVSVPFLGKKSEVVEKVDAGKPRTAYVVLDPILVELGRGGRDGRLRVALTLETDERHKSDVEDRKYRVIDTLNSFLRAVKVRDLREASKIEFIRSRILRRVLLETPRGAVKDVLISEFVVI